MQSTRVRFILLVSVIGIVAVMTLIGLLGASPAFAHAARTNETANLSPPAQPPPPKDDYIVVIVFTDPAKIDITDLSGNPLGTALLEGEVRCNSDNCSQKATLSVSWPFTDPWSLEYKFTSRQLFDPLAERVIVDGTGTIEGRGQRQQFLFTADIQNLRDGTVSVRYKASRPDASFIIERTRATFILTTRR